MTGIFVIVLMAIGFALQVGVAALGIWALRAFGVDIPLTLGTAVAGGVLLAIIGGIVSHVGKS